VETSQRGGDQKGAGSKTACSVGVVEGSPAMERIPGELTATKPENQERGERGFLPTREKKRRKSNPAFQGIPPRGKKNPNK